MNQGNIQFYGDSGGAADANMGASVSGGKVQLGQNHSASGDPALITESRDIPMADGTAVFFGKDDGTSGATGFMPGLLSLFKPASDGGPQLTMFDGTNNFEILYFGTQIAFFFGSAYFLFDWSNNALYFPYSLTTRIDNLARAQYRTTPPAGDSPLIIDNTSGGCGAFFIDTINGNQGVVLNPDALPPSLEFIVAKVNPANTLTISTQNNDARIYDPVTGLLTDSIVYPAGACKSYHFFLDGSGAGNFQVV